MQRATHHREAAIPRPQTLLALPACVALAAGAFGCGGEPLSRAEYVKQADAICADFKKRQDGLGDPKSVQDIERLGEKTKPLISEQLEKLRALEAPDEVADDANASYDLLEQQVPKIDELVDAAKANDIKKIESIATSAGKLDDQADAKARAVGFKVCGKD